MVFFPSLGSLHQKKEGRGDGREGERAKAGIAQERNRYAK